MYYETTMANCIKKYYKGAIGEISVFIYSRKQILVYKLLVRFSHMAVSNSPVIHFRKMPLRLTDAALYFKYYSSDSFEICWLALLKHLHAPLTNVLVI